MTTERNPHGRVGDRVEPLAALRSGLGLLLAVGLGLTGLQLGRRLEPLPRTPDTLAALRVLPEPLREVLLSRAPAPPRPGDLVLGSAALPGLLERLAVADRDWIPRAEPLPDGRVRYLYKRRVDEPMLTLEQIRHRMRFPPSRERERAAITALIGRLGEVGVQVVIGPPRKPRAAGEWDPAARTIRVRSDVVDKGTVEFARVLNHEAIHVAQSCRQGHPSARPGPLGLSTLLDSTSRSHLDDPVYARASALEIRLEREAYANQNQLDLGPSLLASECLRRR